MMARAKKFDPETATFDEITPEVRAGNPLAREDYEHKFEPLSVTHRVLAHITDLVDGPSGSRPRNTVDAMAFSLIAEPAAPGISGPTLELAEAQVQTEVDKLTDAGFVIQRDDGTLALTDDGKIELSN